MAGVVADRCRRLSRNRIRLDSGDIRRIADVMVNTAENSTHQWLNITLVVGGGLVIIGVIVSLLVSLVSLVRTS
ncbi:hypothetical protein BayCH28_06370 [Mycolicibacterium sp. CH28]|nr:hypothetical protein BayCH28_06370 [Mycolicibacterium sp. CH28]